MKKIWLRVGVTISMTDEEADIIVGCGDNSRETLLKILNEGRFLWDGDAYIPEVCVQEFNEEYGTEYEEGEPDFCL